MTEHAGTTSVFTDDSGTRRRLLIWTVRGIIAAIALAAAAIVFTLVTHVSLPVLGGPLADRGNGGASVRGGAGSGGDNGTDSDPAAPSQSPTAESSDAASRTGSSQNTGSTGSGSTTKPSATPSPSVPKRFP